MMLIESLEVGHRVWSSSSRKGEGIYSAYSGSSSSRAEVRREREQEGCC